MTAETKAKTQAEKAAAFEALHAAPGVFVIPNPWDPGSARILAGLGYKALTTTSAGYARSIGFPDYNAGRENVMAHIRAIAPMIDIHAIAIIAVPSPKQTTPHSFCAFSLTVSPQVIAAVQTPLAKWKTSIDTPTKYSSPITRSVPVPPPVRAWLSDEAAAECDHALPSGIRNVHPHRSVATW